MKKAYLLAVAVLVAALSLSGCKSGGNNNGNREGETEVAEEVVDASVAEELAPRIIIGKAQDLEFYFQDHDVFIGASNQAYVASKGFEALKAALAELNASIAGKVEAVRTDVSERLEQEANDDVDFSADNIDWCYESILSVGHVDSRIVCLNFMEETDLGGAHPNTRSEEYCFDVATGRRLSLADVLKDPDSFLEKAKNAIQKEYGKEEWFNDGWLERFNDCLGGNNLKDFFTWSIGADELDIWFNDITVPEEAGDITASLAYKDYPNLLTLACKPVYGQSLAEGEKVNDDFNGIFTTLAENVDKWNYDRCANLFGSTDCDCEFEEPFEGETTGFIRMHLPGTYCISVSTWPRRGVEINYDNPTIADRDNLTIWEAEFYGSRYRAIVDDSYHWSNVEDGKVPSEDRRVRWSIIDGELYTRVFFKSLEEMGAVFFNL